MIQGLATPAHMKLQLIPILQHMHHDTSTAAMVRQLCTDLLPSYPAQEFVLVTLNSLTQLASATLVDIPNQVRVLLSKMEFLSNVQLHSIKHSINVGNRTPRRKGGPPPKISHNQSSNNELNKLQKNIKIKGKPGKV